MASLDRTRSRLRPWPIPVRTATLRCRLPSRRSEPEERVVPPAERAPRQTAPPLTPGPPPHTTTAPASPASPRRSLGCSSSPGRRPRRPPPPRCTGSPPAPEPVPAPAPDPPPPAPTHRPMVVGTSWPAGRGGRGGCRDGAQVGEELVEGRTAPVSRGLLPLPRDWTQEGQPVSQGQEATVSRVAAWRWSSAAMALLGDAGAAEVAVVDEDRGRPGIGMPGGGEAPDVPAVAHGEQGEQPDLGVLGGVGGAGDVPWCRGRRRPAGRARGCTSRRRSGAKAGGRSRSS